MRKRYRNASLVNLNTFHTWQAELKKVLVGLATAIILNCKIEDFLRFESFWLTRPLFDFHRNYEKGVKKRSVVKTAPKLQNPIYFMQLAHKNVIMCSPSLSSAQAPYGKLLNNVGFGRAHGELLYFSSSQAYGQETFTVKPALKRPLRRRTILLASRSVLLAISGQVTIGWNHMIKSFTGD